MRQCDEWQHEVRFSSYINFITQLVALSDRENILVQKVSLNWSKCTNEAAWDNKHDSQIWWDTCWCVLATSEKKTTYDTVKTPTLIDTHSLLFLQAPEDGTVTAGSFG